MTIENPGANTEENKWLSLKEVKSRVGEIWKKEKADGRTAHFKNVFEDEGDFDPELLTESCADLYNLIDYNGDHFDEMYRVGMADIDREIQESQGDKEVTLKIFKNYFIQKIMPNINRQGK